MAREVSDLEINNHIRRLLTKRRIDTNKVTYRTTSGSVTLTGQLSFIGKYLDESEILHEIQVIEDLLKNIVGVKRVTIDFEGYEKDDASGEWQMVAKGPQKPQHVKKESEETKNLRELKNKLADSFDKLIGSAKKEESQDLSTNVSELIDKTLKTDKISSETSNTDDSTPVEETSTVKTDKEVPEFDISKLTKEQFEELLNYVKAFVIKCSDEDCGAEHHFCVKCGSKLKIKVVADEEDFEKSKPSSTPVSYQKPALSAAELLEEEEDIEGRPVVKSEAELKKEAEEKEAKEKPKSIAEKVKELLEKNKEASIKKKGWQRKSKPTFINFDDL